MQVQQLERLPALEPSSALELDRLVSGLRWRLGLEQLARWAIRGTLASGVAAIALSLGIWISGGDQRFQWLSLAPLLAAVITGLLRWPSRQSTALVVDARFVLGERLATALELARGERASRFAAMQVRDAVAQTRSAHGGWLVLDRRARYEVLLAAGVATVAIAVMVVVARLERPIPPPPPVAETSIAEEPPLAGAQTQVGVPLDSEDGVAPAPAQSAAGSADLAARVQQAQAERSALDQLAQALNDNSAGKAAADAIQQGDYGAARDQLQNLADNADQLSNAAKQQLARGLQQAAANTAQSDRALADREQQAAQALARSTYADQRQALRSLADQVQRSGARTVPSDQLERDVGQLQQQSAATPPNGDAATRSSAGASQTGASQSGGAQGDQDANGQQGGQQVGGTATSGQNGAGAGQQIGTGVGTGTDPNLYADQPSKLDSAGQQVQVPLKLGAGQGVRPADGTEDQSAPDPSLGGRTTAELAQQQQTGQVTPEQNLVPGEQRPVVRDYFR